MIACETGVVCVMKQGICSEFIGHGIHVPSLFHVEHFRSSTLESQFSEQMFHVEHSAEPASGLHCLLRQMFHVELFEVELFEVVS